MFWSYLYPADLEILVETSRFTRPAPSHVYQFFRNKTKILQDFRTTIKLKHARCVLEKRLIGFERTSYLKSLCIFRIQIESFFDQTLRPWKYIQYSIYICEINQILDM